MKKLLTESENKEIIEDQGYWYAINNDDPSALNSLFNKYYNDLYFYGLKLVNKKELTADTIQDIFVAIWETRKKRLEVNHIKAYLFASLRNNLLKPKPRNVLNKSESTASLNTKFHFNLSPEDIYLENESKTENVRIIEGLLKDLSPKQKEIIYLKFYNNYSNSEISQVLSIKPQSVANLLQRTINKLRMKKNKNNLLIVNMLISGLI